jgi:hypothetical protein
MARALAIRAQWRHSIATGENYPEQAPWRDS